MDLKLTRRRVRGAFVLAGGAAIAAWLLLEPARAEIAPASFTKAEVPPAESVRVSVFGDSITNSAVDAGRVANAALDDPLQVSWSTAPFLSTWHFQGQLEQAGVSQPDVVVIATGTNDSWDAIGAFQAQTIDDALHAVAQNDCVVWVNVRSEIGPNDVAWNQLLTEKAAAAGNVRIADWDGYSDRYPEAIAEDNVHLSDVGKATYARWLVEQMVLGCP